MTITREEDKCDSYFGGNTIFLCKEYHFCFEQIIWQEIPEGLHIIKNYFGG